MFKKYFTIVCILVAVLLSACAPKTADSEQARQALSAFFEALSGAQYAEAAQLYGGSYETLAGYNPDIDPDDHAALWRRGCMVNGLQCLTIRTATFNELTANGEYIFTVEFTNPDNSLFVLEACCGENPTTPPQFQFEYRVVEDRDGGFRVLDLPVYVP
jgi:hypothetical protein